ncbi:MAG TPA: glycoside hydrolase family 18 protein [Dehalococcoidia bacterium]|nr:glycoside hydrolase family 18 protein [Dehalococcoidia bacterium]
MRGGDMRGRLGGGWNPARLAPLLGLLLLAAQLMPATGGAVRPVAAAHDPSRRIVAYFPLWLRNEGYDENAIDFSTVNTVAHFAVVPRADGSIAIPDWGPFPDPALIARAHAAGATIVLVVGGDDEAARAGFAVMAASAATRDAFVVAVAALVAANGYDGVDLDWEFPADADDRNDLSALATALRTALGAGKTLSVSLPAGDERGRWFDLPALLPNFDWFGIMTYALSGAGWSDHAFHNAALYASFDGEPSLDGAVAYYRARGVPAAKLQPGIPFYGERFDTVSAVGQRLTGADGTAIVYADVLQLSADGWSIYRDATAGVPLLVRSAGPGIVSYDDEESVRGKCAYVAAHGLGGVIVWRLGQDRIGADQPLLRAVHTCR